jgi:hypothetical protein
MSPAVGPEVADAALATARTPNAKPPVITCPSTLLTVRQRTR